MTTTHRRIIGFVAALPTLVLVSACSGDDGTPVADPITVVRTVPRTILVTTTAPPAAPRTVTKTVRLRPVTVTKTVHAAPTAPSKKPSAPKPSCAPGYSPCLPITGDLDCGEISDSLKPISVTGTDPYGLDSDGDGLGCES
jgi:hypothetical protein